MASGTRESEQNNQSHLIFRLPQVFAYLGKKSVWLVLIGLALIVAVLDFIAFGFFGWIATAMMLGLEISVFFQIVHSSAQDHDELHAPDFLSIYDGIIQPILLMVAAALPMLIALYWATAEILSGSLPTRGWPVGPLVLFGAGLLLYPLLITIAAIDKSVTRVLNPVVWIHSLLLLGTSYLVAALGFYAIWGVEILVVAGIATKIQEGPVFGGTAIALLVVYVPRALRYRLLGALCEPFLGQPLDQMSALPFEDDESPIAALDDSEERLKELAAGNMSTRAILRMANAAHGKKRMQLVYRSVEYLWKHHPDCPEMVQALWVAQQAQESEGRSDAMKKTLETLVAHHPNHPMATDARSKLRRIA